MHGAPGPRSELVHAGVEAVVEAFGGTAAVDDQQRVVATGDHGMFDALAQARGGVDTGRWARLDSGDAAVRSAQEEIDRVDAGHDSGGELLGEDEVSLPNGHDRGTWLDPRGASEVVRERKVSGREQIPIGSDEFVPRL